MEMNFLLLPLGRDVEAFLKVVESGRVSVVVVGSQRHQAPSDGTSPSVPVKEGMEELEPEVPLVVANDVLIVLQREGRQLQVVVGSGWNYLSAADL